MKKIPICGLQPCRALSQLRIPPSAGAAALALALLSAPNVSAQVVAGWDVFSGTGADDVPVEAPVVATGVTASFVTTTEQQDWNTGDSRGASSDGTWGTSVGPPAADTTVAVGQNLELPNATSGGTITMTITNNSGSDIELDAFHMDAYSFRFRAARTYTLDVLPGGAITDGNVYTSVEDEISTQGGVPPDNDQGDDIDHDLTFLADSTLENGGTVDFLLTFSGGDGTGNGGHDLWVDNLAVTSSAAGANKLAFIPVVPADATAGMDFSVTVQAQDGSGTPLAVTQDTVIQLTTPTGTGVLSGNTATILMGDDSVTLPTLQYTVAEDITLVASQVSGDLLLPTDESSTISIIAGPPTVLTVETANDGTGDAIGNVNFRVNDPPDTLDVFAISRDSVGNFINLETTAVFSLENITGSVLPGDLADNMDGSATFTAENLGTAVIRAAVATFPDGETGLINVEEPQFRWTGGNGGWGAAPNWLDEVLPPFDNTTDLFFYDEFTSPTQLVLSSTGSRTVRSLNFTEFVDPTVAGGFGIRYLQNNTVGVGRDLIIDTDLDQPAEINIAAGAEASINMGNVNDAFIPDIPANYGNTILADPLLITHLGTGNLIFSRPISETGGPMGVTLDATSTGTVVYEGANTYTGPTTVNGGILRLSGESISDFGTLVIDGGVVDVVADADEQVAGLTLGGVAQPDGIYGSSESTAPVPDDVNFSGPGTVTVSPPPAFDEFAVTDISNTGENQITLTFNSPGNVDVYVSEENDGFFWIRVDTDVAPPTFVDNAAFAAQTFYVLVPTGGEPPANSP